MKEINFKPATNKKSNAEKAKNQMLESNDFRQKMRDLEKIYAIPPDYRMEAASSFNVNDIYRHNHNGLSWGRESIFSNHEIVLSIVEKFKGKSYKETDWGRRKNIWRGKRVLDFPASQETVMSRKGKWNTCDYFANFSVFFHRSQPKILASYDGKCYKIDLAKESIGPLGPNTHILDTAGFSEKFQSGEWVWDPKELSINYGPENFHIYQSDIYLSPGRAKELYHKVISAFEVRRRLKEEASRSLSAPDNLVIRATHSTPETSGNCEIGTRDFRRRYGLTEKDEYTIAELKEKGVDFSNTFLQRAINYAMNHQ